MGLFKKKPHDDQLMMLEKAIETKQDMLVKVRRSLAAALSTRAQAELRLAAFRRDQRAGRRDSNFLDLDDEETLLSQEIITLKGEEQQFNKLAAQLEDDLRQLVALRMQRRTELRHP